ncbi:hypothetical protein ANCDUO_10853 [Ancylostoma duodenale]|uniref:Uncharacterized protein n=1 Tax=Ancylostoma duodenale TaxID=51022 RepID=A0A0C2CQA7_9BILA|nr:hypothetical protein ANCDUO_10853 [Ancylostoma duodenale]
MIPVFCDYQCEQRGKFRLDLFKQRYGLRLRALSWVTVCYDLPYSYHVISSATNSSGEESGESISFTSSPATNLSSLICATFHVSQPHKCPVSTSAGGVAALSLILTALLVLSLE